MSSPCARGILNPLTSHAASLGGRGGRGGGPCPQRETSEDLSVPHPAPSLPGCPPSAPAPAWPGSRCPPSHLWPSARWRAGCEAGGRGEGGRLHGDTGVCRVSCVHGCRGNGPERGVRGGAGGPATEGLGAGRGCPARWHPVGWRELRSGRRVTLGTVVLQTPGLQGCFTLAFRGGPGAAVRATV